MRLFAAMLLEEADKHHFDVVHHGETLSCVVLLALGIFLKMLLHWSKVSINVSRRPANCFYTMLFFVAMCTMHLHV